MYFCFYSAPFQYPGTVLSSFSCQKIKAPPFAKIMSLAETHSLSTGQAREPGTRNTLSQKLNIKAIPEHIRTTLNEWLPKYPEHKFYEGEAVGGKTPQPPEQDTGYTKHFKKPEGAWALTFGGMCRWDVFS